MALSENRDFEYPTSNRSKNFSHWNMAIGGVMGIPLKRIEWPICCLNGNSRSASGYNGDSELGTPSLHPTSTACQTHQPKSEIRGVDCHLPTTSKMQNMLCASGKSILGLGEIRWNVVNISGGRKSRAKWSDRDVYAAAVIWWWHHDQRWSRVKGTGRYHRYLPFSARWTSWTSIFQGFWSL